MEKTLEIHLEEQAKKFIDALKEAQKTYEKNFRKNEGTYRYLEMGQEVPYGRVAEEFAYKSCMNVFDGAIKTIRTTK